jgi:hypothetical protein
MSLGLIKPGIGSANLAGKLHPKTKEELQPIGYVNGKAVWPVIGAASDDEDDPDFTGEGGSDDDEEDDEEDEDDKSKRSTSGKGKHSKDDDDEDEEEEDKRPTRPERQAARYRVQLREAEKREAALAQRLKAIEDKDKAPDEIAERDKSEAERKAAALAEKNRSLTIENAFFKANDVNWVDPADALRLVDLDDVEVDDDGTVDTKALRSALRDLAKRKPHLVKPKPRAEDDDSDDDQGSSAPRMNGRRKGAGKTPSREDLAKRFPVLGRL